MVHSVEDFWGTYDGQKIKFKDLDDDHLLNIIIHVKNRNDSKEFVEFLISIAKGRGFTERFINQPQSPHICKGENSYGIRLGTWAKWCYILNRPVQLSENQAKRSCVHISWYKRFWNWLNEPMQGFTFDDD